MHDHVGLATQASPIAGGFPIFLLLTRYIPGFCHDGQLPLDQAYFILHSFHTLFSAGALLHQVLVGALLRVQPLLQPCCLHAMESFRQGVWLFGGHNGGVSAAPVTWFVMVIDQFSTVSTLSVWGSPYHPSYQMMCAEALQHQDYSR